MAGLRCNQPDLNADTQISDSQEALFALFSLGLWTQTLIMGFVDGELFDARVEVGPTT